MNVANRNQIGWIGWLLHDEEGKKFLGTYIGAEQNIERLKSVWNGEPYNKDTQSMLNYVLEIFNNDGGLKGKYRSWVVSQPF
jgi:hypothetical protein